MTTENAPGENHTEPKATESTTRPDVSPIEMCQEMMGPGAKPMEMCPMATMCKGMMAPKRGGMSWLLLLPGGLLVLGGLAIILVPQILVWLVGLTAIVLGGMFLAIASGIRKVAAGLGHHGGDTPIRSGHR